MKEKVNWIDWKKLVGLLLVFLFISLIVYFSFFYRSVLHSKNEGIEKTESIVSEELNMEVNEIYHFQEKEGFHIAFATDEQNQDWIVFVPLNEQIDKEDFILVEANQVMSQEQIESRWMNDCNQCELVKSGPAMIDNIPLWELTYKDSSNRYVIEYVTLKDGSIFEQLRLYRKYSEKG